MSRTLAIVPLQTTEANLITQATAVNLVSGEIYYVTDKSRWAVALTTSTWQYVPTILAHTIQNQGSALTARANLNFKGLNLTAVDNSGTNSTDVTINDSMWTQMNGTYASASTFTYTCANSTSSDNQAREFIWALFTCTSADGNTRRFGYIKSYSRSTTTMTLTVVSSSDLVTGDINFKIAQGTYAREFQYKFMVPGVQVADSSNPVGAWFRIKFDCYLLPVDSSLKTAAAGTGAACAWNVYKGATNLFSSAQDMTTNATYDERRPDTNTVSDGDMLTIRVTSAAGGTTLPQDLQLRCYVIPQTWILAAAG